MKKDNVVRLFLLKGDKKHPTDAEWTCVKQNASGKTKGTWTDFPLPEKHAYLWMPERGKDESAFDYRLKIRVWGRRWADKARELSGSRWALTDLEWHDESDIRALVESFLLNLYVFDDYKADKKAAPELIAVESPAFSASDLKKLQQRATEVAWVKRLIEQPVSDLNAAELAREVASHVKPLGITAKLWTCKEMEKAGMGGLLGVNRGSVDEPSFTELVYKPANARNKNPLVLVGKGVVFDAGGMNIKTGSYMDDMKTDMAGGAMAAGLIAMAAQQALPLYIVALIPATDNRLNGNALVPGDIIRILGETSVEIVNTDAEGRLLLADAVAYAQKHYSPQMILSMATLTGAASRAIGTKGVVAMQEGCSEAMLQCLAQASEQEQERYCMFPMWKEYDTELDSPVAELKNCGSGAAGMITAAKFVGYFAKKTPFLHLDVAGVAYFSKDEGAYRKGATGMGVRWISRFLALWSEKLK